jgi:hypothetical protein
VGIIRRFEILVAILAALITSGGAGPAIASDGDDGLALSTEERQQIERGLRELTRRLELLRGSPHSGVEARPDRIADAEVFAKGIIWALNTTRPSRPRRLTKESAR